MSDGLEKLRKGGVVKLYDENAMKYEAFYGDEQRPKFDLALEIAEPKPPILDAGCGTGLLLPRLGQLAVGLDISLRMLKVAVDKGVRNPLVLADVETLPFRENSFSTIYSITVIQLSEHPSRTLKEMSKVLKRGGKLVVSAHRATDIAGMLVRLADEAGLRVVVVRKPCGPIVDLIVLYERPQYIDSSML